TARSIIIQRNAQVSIRSSFGLAHASIGDSGINYWNEQHQYGPSENISPPGTGYPKNIILMFVTATVLAGEQWARQELDLKQVSLALSASPFDLESHDSLHCPRNSR